ncbi:hypothetical protein MRX96_006568 [Rhipicephalus microplus]
MIALVTSETGKKTRSVVVVVHRVAEEMNGSFLAGLFVTLPFESSHPEEEGGQVEGTRKEVGIQETLVPRRAI